MKKFMIFLLMAFLYLGTSQASNEFTASSNDVGKSLHHWVSPSVGSPAYAKFKPFSSDAPIMAPAAPSDSTVRVYLVGPTSACPGQIISLTAVVENNIYGDSLKFAFRRNGNFTIDAGINEYRNRITFTVPDLGGLDSLIQEYDVVVSSGCHKFSSPVFYLRINSIHVQLDSVYVCNDTDKGELCATVYSNQAEAPYAYVWYDAATNDSILTTWDVCAELPVGKYVVEPHFTWNGCVTKSDTATVSVMQGPAEDHITMDDIAALACNGNQVEARLHGIIHADSLGTPSVVWTLNGRAISGAADSVLFFSPLSVAGDTTMYVLKAEVSYANYPCKTFVKEDTIQVLADPTIAIYGDAIVCGDELTGKELYARTNGYIDNPSYKWRIDGVEQTAINKDTLKLADVTTLAARNYPYEISVSVIGGNSCSAESETFFLYLNAAPSMVLSKSADTVCKNSEITLTAVLADNNIPNLTYKWFRKVGTAGTYEELTTVTTAQYTTTISDSTSYKVSVKQTDSDCSVEDSTMVYVYPKTGDVKDLVLEVSDTLVCYGGHIDFTLVDTANTKQFGEGTYYWTVNGVNVDVHGHKYSFSPATTDNNSTIYNIEVRADYANACNNFTASIDTAVMVVKNPSVVIAGDPIVCDGTGLNLTAVVHDTLSGTSISYLWRVDGVDSSKTATFTDTLDQRDYPYELTVVLNAGTACEVESAPFTVLIGSNPTAALETSDTIVCKGQDVTLTAHLGDYNMPNLTYQWYRQEGNGGTYDSIPVGTSSVLTIPVADTTKYFVKISQVNSECVAYSDTVKVSVYGETESLKDMVLVASDTAVCYGGQLTYAVIDTANIKQYGKGTYQWSVNGVSISGATDSIYVFSPEAVDNNVTNYLVAVNVTYTTPCTTISAAVDTNVKAFRNPSVVIAGDPIVCDGTGLNLTAVVHDTLSGALISYLWKVDGVDSSKTATFTDTLDQRDYPYELTVVLNAGTACEVESAPFTVLIGSNPTAALETSDTIVCKGQDVTLTAHLGDYNMPNLTYQWYRQEGNGGTYDSIAIGTSRVLTIPVADTTKYFVKITQVNSECVAYSDTVKVSVYGEVEEPAALVMFVNDSIICNGGQTALAIIDTANIRLFGKGVYEWAVNGVTVANANDSIYNFSPIAFDNDSTLYNIAAKVTYTTPCSVITASIDTIVNVFSNPSVVISGDPIICQDSTVTLVATVHDTVVGKTVSYLWRVDGIDSVNQNTSIFSATLPVRDYPYEITVVINQGAGCSVESDVYSVLIGNNPTVALEVSDPIICKGNEVTLTAHLGDYNMPNLVYQWYKRINDEGDTLPISIGTSRILTVPVTDTTRYFVHIQQVNSHCEIWADTLVYVYPKDPEVKPIELIASDSNICIGGQIAYTVLDTANRRQYFGADSIPGAYRWFVNGFELMTVSGDHFTFSPSIYDMDTTNYVIEVVASYQTECNLWTIATADSITVHRNPSVVINGDPMICDTTAVHLYAIVNDTLTTAPLTSYLWRVDGVDSVGKTTAEFVDTLPARDYPYEITVVLNKGTNCEIVSEPFYLYIEDQPEVVVTVDYDTVCQGQVVNLTAHLGNYNQANLTYQWFADSDSIYYGTEPTLAYTITKAAGETTRFKVIVTQLNSVCQGTGFDSVYTFKNPVLDTILVTNLHDDVADAYYHHYYYNQPAYDLCEGASVQVTAWLKDETGARYLDTNLTYKWKRNGVVIEGVTGYSFMEQYAILDHDQNKYVYTVEIDEPYYPNCYSIPTAVNSDTVKVRRNPGVIISGQEYVCYQGPSVNNISLLAWVDGKIDTGYIYKWYRDGMLETNPLHMMRGAMFTGNFAPRYGFNYTFQVEVVNGNGCSRMSEPFEVTVMAPPVVNITPYTDTICAGGDISLVSHLNDYNTDEFNVVYQWYANEVSTATLIEGANEPYYYNDRVDSTTNYIVDVRYRTENAEVANCFSRDTMTVHVYDIPVIDSIIMSLTEICEGAQVQMTAVMDSVHQGVPNVPYIYEWYRNGDLLLGNAVDLFDSPMTVDGNEQQYTYSVIVYQDPERMNCRSSRFVSSQTLTVYPNPIVGVSGDQNICYTDTIRLTAHIDTIANPVSTNVHYYWFESGEPIVNMYGDSCELKYYGIAKDEPYKFTVEVEREEANRGCRSYSYEYDVWVHEAPEATVTIVDADVCEGAIVTATAHLNLNTPEQLDLQYQWYTKTPKDTNYVMVENGGTEMTYTTAINDTTEFRFVVTNVVTGCADTASQTINTHEIPVVLDVVMSDTNVCEGSDMIITAVIDTTKGVKGQPYFYEWRRNGEPMEGNTATIHDQPMTADGTTQTYVYSVIAYQTPERLACYSELVESDTLTVFGDPRVAISGDQNICYTDTILLTANVDTFAYPVGDLHYLWYESGHQIVNLNGDSKNLKYYGEAKDEPYVFTVQVERDNAEAGCRAYSNEYNVWVHKAPEASVTIVDADVCEGAEVTVTAHLNLNTPEQLDLQYQWYTKTPKDTQYVKIENGGTEMTYTTTIYDTTEFRFVVTNVVTGCADTASQTIKTHKIPVVNFVSMSDTNVCEGAQVTIYAEIDTTKGVKGQPYFFEWTRNGEPLAANTQTIFDSPMTVDGNEQTYVYSVIAYQTPERLACYSESVKSATLNVFPNPRVAISGDQYVCETDSVFLYANVDTIARPVGLLHYTWFESGRLRDNLAYNLADSRFFSEYFYPQAEPYRFTVEVQRDDIAAGCRAYSEEFLVWVYEQPVVNITASETEICRGGEVILRANLDNYEFNYANDATYQWYTVDTVEVTRHYDIDETTGEYIDSVFKNVEHNPIPGATTLVYRTTLDSTRVFAFTATHNTSGCSDYDEITINVNPIPVIDSITNVVGKDTVCPGGPVELVAHVSGGVAGGEVYTWTRNGEELESTGANLIDYPLAVDNNITRYIYEVKVKQTAAGCESIIDSLSTDTIWVVPNPTIELSGDPIVCDTVKPYNITITANVVSYVDTTNYGYTYMWYENNHALDSTGLVLNIHKPYRDYPYSFNFEVKNPYGCTVLSEPFLVYVNDNPIVGITVDDTMICKKGTVTLAADLYDQNASNLVFSWYKQVEGSNTWDSIPGAYSMTYTAVELDTTTSFKFYVFQRDSHCDAYSNEIKVNVVPAPEVDSITVVSIDTVICEGHIVTLKANISGGDTTDTPVYTWYKDHEVVVGQTGDTFTDYPMSVDNEITAHVYNVTVAQASDACFSLYDENDEVTVTVRPNPRYTIYGDADVCEPNGTDKNIKLYGRTTDSLIASTTAYTYNYKWYEEDTLLTDQTEATLEVNRPYRTEPYIFKLVVADNEFGCTTETEEFEVYVSARPIVNVTSTEDTICTNGVVVLTANIFDQNADNLTYQWWKKVIGHNDSTIILGANNPDYTAVVDSITEFFVVVKQLTTDCQTVASRTITVNPIPVIDSITNVVGKDTICPGGHVELMAHVSGGVAGGEVYTWTRNGEELESTGANLIDNPLAVDNNITRYIYEVVVKQTANACQSVITSRSTDTIWVVPNPTIELAGDQIVCEAEGTGNNITISANVVSYVDTTNYGYTYMWYENNAPIDSTGLVLNIHKDYREYPYSFNFEVKNPYGCTVQSEPFLVYVYDKPIVGITVDDTMICKKGTVTLTADLYDQNASNLVFKWYKKLEGSNTWDSIPGAYSMTYTAVELDTTTSFKFYAYQRDSYCEAYSNEIKVNVVPAPEVDSITVVSIDTVICEGHIVTLKANISGGDTTDTPVYTWYKDHEVVVGQTGDTFTDYPMSVDNEITAHVYNVTVRHASDACFSLYDENDEVTVTVRPNPRYTIYGDPEVCESDGTDNNIKLYGRTTDSLIVSDNAYTYTWYESDSVQLNQNQNTTTLDVMKPYRDYPYYFKMVVTDSQFGCSYETEEFVVTVAKRPVVHITVDQDSICKNGQVVLTSTLADADETGIVYQWQDSVSGDTWKNIEGAIAPSYESPALTADKTFRLTVENTLTGCTSTSNEVFVRVKDTPSINIVSMTDTILCNGGEVTFIATGDTSYQGLGTITYQWYENGVAVIGANHNIYTTSPLTVQGDMTTYSIGVQVTMSNSGCESNIDTNLVIVYKDPTVNITSSNGLKLCEGGETILKANPHHEYFTDYTYQWYLHGQPISGETADSLLVAPTAVNDVYDYTVEVTVNRGSQIGCSVMSAPANVTVVNDPTAYITVAENVNAICEGGTVTFTVHVTDGEGVADNYNPYTYAWYNNISGNGVVLGTEASFTTSADDAANLYVYMVDVTSGYGCDVRVSDTLRIVEDPTVTIAVKTGADTVVCNGGRTTLVATVEGGLGEVSYQWYKNGDVITGANNYDLVTDELYVTEPAAYTVSVTQTGIACTATSSQFNVPVYEALSVTLSANSEINCVGGTVTLTATTSNGLPEDMLTYQWFRNDNPINGVSGNQYVTDDNLVAGYYEYHVVVTSNVSGCGIAHSGTKGITVETEPEVVISSDVNTNSICAGGDMTLTANVIYATNATNRNNTYIYTWNWYEGTTLKSATTTAPHFTLPTTLAAGSYNFYVEIESNDGLGCDASSISNLFNVVVKPVPTVILTANAAESCFGGDVTFNAVVIPSNLTGIFYWNVGGNSITTNSASITVNDMNIGTNNISVFFAPDDEQVACQSATTTITHVVNAIPVVTVKALDTNRLSMCVGGTITIAATATGTANSSDRYVWTVDGMTQAGNTGNTFTTQLNTPGNHFFSAMVERAMGCNSKYSTPVVVSVAEQPTAQLTQTAGFAEMCAGGTITLMAKVPNYAAVNNGVTNNLVHDTYTYTWYRDFAEFMTSANVTADNAQITETLNTPASYTYSVKITASGYNCQAADATLDHQIKVVPDPSWSVNQVNPTELCIGGIVTLNADVTGGVESQQAGRIQWYKTFNGVESEVAGLGGVNTDVPEAAGVYSYAPKYIDYIGAGCNIEDATATQVTVNDLPTAVFSAGHGSVICGHDYQSFATLEITLTGTAPFTFVIENVTTGESQTIVTSLSVYPYNVNPGMTSIYRIVSVSDANGCVGALDNVADAVISVSDVQIMAETVVVSCEDWRARIPVKVNASTSTTYTATVNDSISVAVTPNDIVFDAYTQQHYVEIDMTGFAAGDYVVTVTIDGCTGDVNVRVPANDASMGVSSALVDQRWDDVVVVNNNPDNNGGYKFNTYQWYKNGEPINGATGQYYQEVGGLEGFYSVELDGVRVSDGAPVHFVTCEKFFSANSSVKVYPVPAKSTQEVTVELNLSDEELNGAILDIYDVRGAHVKTITNLTPITKVDNFGAQGTYFGRIITGTNEIKTVKFIIVK